MEYGVVFGGGGSRGSYEIGVWKALLEMGIKIKAVAGTSVGALNGAMLAQGDFEIAQKVWSSLDIKSIIKLENPNLLSENRIGLREFVTHLKQLWKDGGLDITPLNDMLNKYIDEERVRKSAIDFGLVTYSISELKPVAMYKEDIPKGQLVDYLIASASLPIFKHHVIENKRLIDGGVYDNIPVSLIVEKGIKNVIVADCSGYGRTRKIYFDGVNTTCIKNSEHLGGILQFDTDIIKHNIEVGYLDTLKAFKKLKGKKYFIQYNKKTSTKLAFPLTQTEIKRLISTMDLGKQQVVTDKLSNYRILRTIKSYSGNDFSESTAVLAALEITAEVFGIDLLKNYKPDELALLILDEYYKIRTIDFVANPLETIKTLIPDKIADLKNVDIKYLAGIGAGDDKSAIILNYRKFLAATLPKICIANLFVSLLLWRVGKD